MIFIYIKFGNIKNIFDILFYILYIYNISYLKKYILIHILKFKL